MILISHRGLINGPDKHLENTESAVLTSLLKGFDVEIDIWFNEDDQCWYLGHDLPMYKTNLDFVTQKGLWLHCKNVSAANKIKSLIVNYPHLNFFWHENDERTLTSQGYWWTFPDKELGNYSIAVMPERYTPINNLQACLDWNCFGVCSDYVGIIK